MSDGFSDEQKRYLEGLASGLAAARAAQGLPPLAAGGGRAEPAGPDAIHWRAQDATAARGGKLVAEEQAKRAKHPFDMWDEMQANAQAGRFPKGTDVFLYKFHGLFYVAPAQDAFMCRLRLPNGILSGHQLRGLADLAERLAGGYADITTRANFQLREIRPENAVALLEGLQDLGITSRGAGADNIRNITGDPTAGIDPQALADTRPLCRELHHMILNHRELYGLPRKFNIAFDGGGRVAVLEDTNDIAFAAVRVGPGRAVPEGVWFRMSLGGITGHGDFARDTGVLLKPSECLAMAQAVVRVFIDLGDRTDRRKARMKYVIDRIGLDAYMAEVRKRLAFEPLTLPAAECEPRLPRVKHAHVGVHAQSQPGLYYAGVVVPMARLAAAQMRGLADLADELGSGTLRLTVWQNLLVSDLPEARLADARRRLAALGLSWDASAVRAGLVACTGNAGCKFAASDTKRHARAIADYLDARLKLDQPINIHLTGCHHSCAQHYIGDIGLLATKVDAGETEVEGYHVYVGGGYGAERGIATEVAKGVPAEAVPALIERMLAAYLKRRTGPEQGFAEFCRARAAEELREIFYAADEPSRAVA
ncbi:MAG: NirA family protein [Pseudomonadota bacterium]